MKPLPQLSKKQIYFVYPKIRVSVFCGKTPREHFSEKELCKWYNGEVKILDLYQKPGKGFEA